MAPKYIYETSSEYINALQFDYIETYSFQRNKEFKAAQKKQMSRYLQLNELKKNRNLTEDEESDLLRLSNNNESGYLINQKGQFHSSSEKTHTFKRTDEQVKRLITILQTKAVDIPGWMCAPIYRDAIVFYNSNGSITSSLNVCLSCEYISIKPFFNINADVKTYLLLKQFFIELGHEVELDKLP